MRPPREASRFQGREATGKTIGWSLPPHHATRGVPFWCDCERVRARARASQVHTVHVFRLLSYNPCSLQGFTVATPAPTLPSIASMSVFCCSVCGTFPITTSSFVETPYATVCMTIGAHHGKATDDDNDNEDALSVNLMKYVGHSVSKFKCGDGDFAFACGPARIVVSDSFLVVNVHTTIFNNLFSDSGCTVSTPEFQCTAPFYFGGQCVEHHGHSFLFKTGSYNPQVPSATLSLTVSTFLHPTQLQKGFIVYFNVFCDFLDTPRWANTPAPPVGSSAFITATFAYTDNNNFCHYNILELNFLRDKTAPLTAGKKRLRREPSKAVVSIQAQEDQF
jgi:hypothetical protein